LRIPEHLEVPEVEKGLLRGEEIETASLSLSLMWSENLLFDCACASAGHVRARVSGGYVIWAGRDKRRLVD